MTRSLLVGALFVVACGTVGDTTTSCGVLDRFSDDTCGTLPPPWSCGGDGCNEVFNVIKPGPGAGGALCCVVDVIP